MRRVEHFQTVDRRNPCKHRAPEPGGVEIPDGRRCDGAQRKQAGESSVLQLAPENQAMRGARWATETCARLFRNWRKKAN